MERVPELRLELRDLLGGGRRSQGCVINGSVHTEPGRETVPRHIERGKACVSHAMTLDRTTNMSDLTSPWHSVGSSHSAHPRHRLKFAAPVLPLKLLSRRTSRGATQEIEAELRVEREAASQAEDGGR
ncbi:hypothetical protein GCM10010238_58610 [Streptomyces griseoviridis]|uniref:Uncharacterized protein n=1 Tax=Streptomyces griseoviridis TaxID=45398 RepID=A0A918GUH9_STRGD|nr:hypothetical protein GCM10010238_58610 [Streptomyces niveoruber]